MRYYFVEDGEIARGPVSRAQLRHPTVSIGAGTSDAELAALGWFAEVEVGKSEAFDPATHKRTGPVRAIADGKVTLTWTVVALTQSEIDDRTDAEREDEIEAYGKLGLIVGFDQENRIRALEGKDPVTADQFRSALKARL